MYQSLDPAGGLLHRPQAEAAGRNACGRRRLDLWFAPEPGPDTDANHHIQGAGALARFELRRLDNSELIEAVLTRARYRELQLREGERVFLRPRRMRVFIDNYQI